MALYTALGFMPTGEERPLPKDESITERFLARPIPPSEVSESS
jgi:hypothetical protein